MVAVFNPLVITAFIGNRFDRIFADFKYQDGFAINFVGINAGHDLWIGGVFYFIQTSLLGFGIYFSAPDLAFVIHADDHFAAFAVGKSSESKGGFLVKGGFEFDVLGFFKV